MHLFKKTPAFLLSLLIPAALFSQDDKMQREMDSIAALEKTPKEFVYATFKTTRIINLQTTETAGRRSLDYRIQHRFGELNSGANNAWGIDGPANLYMSLEYSHDGRLMFSIGRSSMDKLSEGFLKYRLIRQTKDKRTPLSITLFSSMNYTAKRDPNRIANGFDKYQYRWDRFSYCNMMIIGRKFTDWLSIEIAPMMIHYNLVQFSRDKNDVYAVGIGGRYKLGARFALSAEYIFRLNKYTDTFDNYFNSAAVGFDIETGGHVFQIHFTNSLGINETQFVPYTNTSWNTLGIRLGFNMSRVFSLAHQEKWE